MSYITLQKAISNENIWRIDYNIAMEQLTELQNKAAEMKKSSAGMSDNTTTTS